MKNQQTKERGKVLRQRGRASTQAQKQDVLTHARPGRSYIRLEHWAVWGGRDRLTRLKGMQGPEKEGSSKLFYP